MIKTAFQSVGLDKNSTECLSQNASFPYCIYYASLSKAYCSQLKSYGKTVDGVISTTQGIVSGIGSVFAPVVAPVMGIVEGVGAGLQPLVAPVVDIVSGVADGVLSFAGGLLGGK